MTREDDGLRRKQAEAERKHDRRWDSAQRHGEFKPAVFRERAFAEEGSRVALAMMLLRDGGESEEAVVQVVVSVLHLGDPLIVRDVESAICAAQNTVQVALIRLGRGFPIGGDDE